MNQETRFQLDYDEIDLVDLLKVLLKSWKLIAVVFLITVIIVANVTYFIIPKKYRSQTLFSLETEGKFGATFGQVNMVKDVIQSNRFLKSILETVGAAVNQGQINALRSAITISQTEAKNIKLQFIGEDPHKVYDLLNMIYDHYQAQVAERIDLHTTNILKVAEENFNRNKDLFEKTNSMLADFQKTNGIIFLPEQLTISDQYYHDFKGQLVVSAERLTEYERLVAEHAAVRANYIKSYNILEDTRRSIERERNYLFVTIEPPVFPEHKYAPSTVMNTAIAGIVALFVGVMVAFAREYIRNYREQERKVDLEGVCNIQ